jgi:hypothetical protein
MERVGWWVGEVTVETKVSCRAGHTTQAPDPEKKDKIQSDVRIVPTQQQVDGQQLLPLFVLSGFPGSCWIVGCLSRGGREEKREG